MAQCVFVTDDGTECDEHAALHLTYGDHPREDYLGESFCSREHMVTFLNAPAAPPEGTDAG